MNECPNCHSSHKIGIEVQGIYDGVLFWQCTECGTKFHRFQDEHMREKAERYVNPH